MAETPDQVRPLAPATSLPTSSDEEETSTTTAAKLRRKKLIKCGAAAAGILLLPAAIIIILIFTVFRVRDPIIQMNAVTIVSGGGASAAALRPGSNLTLNADVSVKNPNFASFKYPNTTSTLYYRGAGIGEARGPPGRARARRTVRMNLTVEVDVNQLVAVPGFGSDVGSGVVEMSSFTRVGGRVRILGISRHVSVRMNCSMSVNITSQAIQEQKCRRRVNL